MVQFCTTAEIQALDPDLDIFDSAAEPAAELVVRGLYPPLPLCSGTLLWGFPILRAARRENIRQLNCLSIPNCSSAEMLTLALKLENRAGSYTWPEKERMLAYLSRRSTASEGKSSTSDRSAIDPLIQELSPLIESRPDSQLAARIETFAQLPGPLKSLVAEQQVDLKTAARVQSLPAGVFARLRAELLSFSQRRQFLNELFEVSRKSKLDDQEISDLVQRALADAEPLERVHRLRYPMLTQLEDRFAGLERELLKGSGVNLKPPPYFEGEEFSVHFPFNSAATFRRRLKALHALDGHLDALFELLH